MSKPESRKFEKWQACGNDFIIVSGKLEEVAACDRHFGIGADGVLYVDKSDVADAKMTIINSDGSEAEMCGNGIRCVGQYVSEKLGKAELSVETKAGVKHIAIEQPYKQIRVNMGRAEMKWQREIELTEGVYQATFVDIGNPHCVLFLKEVREGEVERIGPKIEHLPLFKEGTNVEFVTVEGEELRVRVWERGCGRTLACGTGACASAFAAHMNKLVSSKVKVKLDGGEVEIALSDSIYMTGPAERVYRGEIEQQGGV